MSFFKETSTLKGPEQAEQVKETDHPKVKNSDNHRWLDLEDRSGAHLSDVLSSAFKALGLTKMCIRDSCLTALMNRSKECVPVKTSVCLTLVLTLQRKIMM